VQFSAIPLSSSAVNLLIGASNFLTPPRLSINVGAEYSREIFLEKRR
jgi:hypothetical protein